MLNFDQSPRPSRCATVTDHSHRSGVNRGGFRINPGVAVVRMRSQGRPGVLRPGLCAIRYVATLARKGATGSVFVTSVPAGADVIGRGEDSNIDTVVGVRLLVVLPPRVQQLSTCLRTSISKIMLLGDICYSVIYYFSHLTPRLCVSCSGSQLGQLKITACPLPVIAKRPILSLLAGQGPVIFRIFREDDPAFYISHPHAISDEMDSIRSEYQRRLRCRWKQIYRFY